jgi:hypothetical protein
MLFHLHAASFDASPIIHRRPAPGSVYRSPQVYARLRGEIEADNTTADAISTIWKRSYKGVEWKPCVNMSTGGILHCSPSFFVSVLCPK